MKKKLNDIEKLLRDGRLPDTDTMRFRHQAWKRILQGQRTRRSSKSLLKLQPWIWTLGSLLLIIICILLMFYLGK